VSAPREAPNGEPRAATLAEARALCELMHCVAADAGEGQCATPCDMGCVTASVRAALDALVTAARQEEREAIVADLRDCEARSAMPKIWHEAVSWAVKIIEQRAARIRARGRE